MAKNGNFRLLLLQIIQADLTNRSPPGIGIQWPGMAILDCYCYRSHRQMNWQIYAHPTQRHLVANNGNFRLLFLQVIQADQLADLPPPVEASSGQEYQFQIAIVTGHIGRLTDRSIPLVEASRGQEWQFQITIVTGHIGRSTGRFTPQQRHLMAKNGNFRLLLFRSHRQINWQIYPHPKQRHLVAKNDNF